MCEAARMYRLGDLYQSPTLCDSAIYRFKELTRSGPSVLWDDDQVDDLCEAADMAYNSTPECNKGLHVAVARAVEENLRNLWDNKIFSEFIMNNLPELSAYVLLSIAEVTMAHGACGYEG